MTQEETHLQMTQTPVQRLIPRLAVPTIISMLVTSLYNMADTFFVSQISTSASAAVGVSFSLMTMIQAIGYTLGMGSGNFISRSLGKKDREKAEIVAAVGFFSALALGLLLTVLGLSFLRPLIDFLGTTKTVAPHATAYARWILLGTPVMTGSFVLSNLLRSQGKTFLSMCGLTAGGLLNILLDPILIFRFHMDITGAAVATLISQVVSFILLIVMTLRSDVVRPALKRFRLSLWAYREILHAGLPSLCRQGLASVASVLLNTTAAIYGDAAIAAMSIVTRIMMFINSALIGFGQGFQPVCGFNFGAGRWDRVLRAYFFCVRVAVCLLTLLGIGFFLGASHILALFRDDPEVIRIGSLALRLQCLMLPFQAVIIMVNMLTQSIGYGFRASLVSIGRQGLFFIPAILTLPRGLGILGLQLTQPAADFFTFLLAVAVAWFVVRGLKRKAREEGQEIPALFRKKRGCHTKLLF